MECLPVISHTFRDRIRTKMSHHIPFEIQSEIMKCLPVKSLIQFRSVSKQWKSLIDSPKFIKSYHINNTNPQHRLFLRYELDTVQTYTSIVDNNNFPTEKFPLTAPESLSFLTETSTVISSVDGLLCFFGYYEDRMVAVIWNPTVRKSVGILIPKPSNRNTFVGFGVCPDTSDLNLVKINVAKITSMWEVDVFTLSTCVWKTVLTDTPFKLCNLKGGQVFVDGVLYFRAYVADESFDLELFFNFVFSFDFKSEKFGEVCIPERLVHTLFFHVVKVNEWLGLLDYEDGEVCGVWVMKDGANKPFTKIYTVEVGGMSVYGRVLGFRNNGEVVMELDDDNFNVSRIGVYEPLSGHVNGVGVNGNRRTFNASSYMETLLLLDELESDCIIH